MVFQSGGNRYVGFQEMRSPDDVVELTHEIEAHSIGLGITVRY